MGCARSLAGWLAGYCTDKMYSRIGRRCTSGSIGHGLRSACPPKKSRPAADSAAGRDFLGGDAPVSSSLGLAAPGLISWRLCHSWGHHGARGFALIGGMEDVVHIVLFKIDLGCWKLAVEFSLASYRCAWKTTGQPRGWDSGARNISSDGEHPRDRRDVPPCFSDTGAGARQRMARRATAKFSARVAR